MKIIDNNNEIINNIREIYKTAPAHKIHQLIAKHFIPLLEEKKENAEIPTPIVLVEEMLDNIPIEFWKTIQKVFKPCCGKGIFVMKIYEMFFNGLVELYPEETKKCYVIIKECFSSNSNAFSSSISSNSTTLTFFKTCVQIISEHYGKLF